MGRLQIPMRCAVLSLSFVAALGGCTAFPDLDAAQTPGLRDAAFPKLVSLDGLLVGPEPRATVAMAGSIEGRVAGLQARAARLRRHPPAPGGIAGRLARLQQKAAALRSAE
ncbi:hypothetical protein ACN2XU_14405 [Primorskyibacter sp. 2E107]